MKVSEEEEPDSQEINETMKNTLLNKCIGKVDSDDSDSDSVKSDK